MAAKGKIWRASAKGSAALCSGGDYIREQLLVLAQLLSQECSCKNNGARYTYAPTVVRQGTRFAPGSAKSTPHKILRSLGRAADGLHFVSLIMKFRLQHHRVQRNCQESYFARKTIPLTVVKSEFQFPAPKRRTPKLHSESPNPKWATSCIHGFK